MNSIEILTTLMKVEKGLPAGSFKNFLIHLLENNLGPNNADMSEVLTKLEKENINDEACLVAFIANLFIDTTERVIKENLIELAMRI